MAILATTPFPYRSRPLTNISPLSYRDGETFALKLETLASYINNSMRPEFNEQMALIIEDFQAGILNAENTITGTLTDWTTRFDAFMANIVSELEALNDTAVAALVANAASELRGALDTWVAGKITAALANGEHSLFIDITKAPYNVVFDAPVWTPEILAQNTAGLRLAATTPGFIAAPAGWCQHNGDIGIGQHTYFSGRGIGATTFQVAAGLGWNPRSFYFIEGTTEAGLEKITSDGNQENRIQTDGLGGIYGTNVSIINSVGIIVQQVKAINSVQHGFDVTTPYYGQAGDGATIPGASEHVVIRDCIADKYGDDGFSTHGSGKVLFDNCRALGTRYSQDVSYANSNGFEIDDYSYDTALVNCYATGNAHGFEVKAHGDQSAGTNVRLINCMAEKNQVNFSARHIGHHTASHPMTKTAKHISVVGCTFKNPRRVFFGGTVGSDGDVPDNETPAGQQYNNVEIGAYRGVSFVSTKFLGDPNYNYGGAANVLIHYKAQDVTFNSCYFEGYTTGTWDVQSTGGDASASYLTVSDCTFRDSAINGISSGAASQGIIMNNRFNRTVLNSPNGVGITIYGNKMVRGNQFITPFAHEFNISGTWYTNWETPLSANTGGVPAV